MAPPTRTEPYSTEQMDALVAAVQGLKPHDNFFGAEFFAAIIGAVIGGLIATGIQYFSYREQRREKLALDRQRQATNAFSILTKINRAYTTISAVKNQTDKAVLECVRREMRLSAAFEAFSGDMPRFDLTSDEVEFLRTTKDVLLISAILDLPHVHDMYVDTLALLRDHKLKIVELQESTVIRADGSGTSVFRGANAYKAQLGQFQADKLVGALIGFTLKDYLKTKELLRSAQKKFIEVVGKEHIGVVWDVQFPITDSSQPREMHS